MNDLAPLLLAGEATVAAGWTRDDVRLILDMLACPGWEVDWEPGDEEWGRVLDSCADVAALVCARIPVGFVRADVDAGRLSGRVRWLAVKSMKEPAFRVDRALLERIFGRPMSNAVDYERLTIQDLWWATVT